MLQHSYALPRQCRGTCLNSYLGFFSRLQSAKHHPYCLERLTRRASNHSDLPELGIPKNAGGWRLGVGGWSFRLSMSYEVSGAPVTMVSSPGMTL